MTTDEHQEAVRFHLAELARRGVEAKLNGLDLRGAWMWDVDLSGAKLINANLEAADLHGAFLGTVNFLAANLSYARFDGADFHGAFLAKAKLGAANLPMWPRPWRSMATDSLQDLSDEVLGVLMSRRSKT